MGSTSSIPYLKLQEEEPTLVEYYTADYKDCIDLAKLEEGQYQMIEPTYRAIRNKFRKPFSTMNEKKNNSAENKCSHPPSRMIDLSDESGDIVCSDCGSVVMERVATWKSSPEKDLAEITDFSPSYPKFDPKRISPSSYYIFSERALDLIQEACSSLKIDENKLKYQVLQAFEDSSKDLNIPWDKFLSLEKFRPHLAYAFFAAITEQAIWRHPEQVANIFGVSYKQLLKSENTHYSMRTWRYFRRPSIYCKPSQLTYIVCAEFDLSYPVSATIASIIHDVESMCYGTSPEKIIYHVIRCVLELLDPKHPDKDKLDKLDHLRDNMLHVKISLRDNFSLHIPDSVILKYMIERKLI